MPTLAETKKNLPRMVREAFFRELYNNGMAAGAKAAEALTPRAMVVSYKDLDGTPRSDYIADGVCGFAWVNVSPGTSPFAKWLKTQGLAHKSYDGGVDIWISDYNQSMQKKEAHAHAMAQVFSDAGHRATGRSRMD